MESWSFVFVLLFTAILDNLENRSYSCTSSNHVEAFIFLLCNVSPKLFKKVLEICNLCVSFSQIIKSTEGICNSNFWIERQICQERWHLSSIRELIYRSVDFKQKHKGPNSVNWRNRSIFSLNYFPFNVLSILFYVYSI